MPKRWRIQPHEPERIIPLGRALGIPTLVAQLLYARGVVELDDGRAFLEEKLSHLREPELLPGAVEAAARIQRAVADRRRIVIYGDYDVDGMTATALLWRCLRLLGGDVGYYVPNRLEEGYGLSCEALSQLAAQGARMVITVDCGITSVAEAAHARELGIELIVTDHHQMAATLPEAAALVHPGLPGGNYPFAGLSGSGVAFKLAWAICQQASQAKKVSPAMREYLLEATALAALGTVADVVPLIDENRVLVRHGLESLRQRPATGLAALLRVTGLAEKSRLDADDVGFMLAPRLNAAGRLGQAQLAVELLTTDQEDRAETLAQYIHELNDSRQSLERSIYLQAHKQAQELFDPANDPALVLAGRGWHVGVIGIVAGRLAEKYHRPVVLISLDEVGVKPGVGSARSIRKFDLHQALTAQGHHLVAFGGHAAAAGLKIEEGRLEDFRADFCEFAAAALSTGDLEQELRIDAEAPLSAFSLAAVEQIERLAPFGQGNARPMFCASQIRLDESPKTMGGSGRHLSLRVSQHGTQMRAVAFGAAEWAEDLARVEGPLDLAFRPVINEFRGRRNVELQLADWRVAVPLETV